MRFRLWATQGTVLAVGFYKQRREGMSQEWPVLEYLSQQLAQLKFRFSSKGKSLLFPTWLGHFC